MAKYVDVDQPAVLSPLIASVESGGEEEGGLLKVAELIFKWCKQRTHTAKKRIFCDFE